MREVGEDVRQAGIGNNELLAGILPGREGKFHYAALGARWRRELIPEWTVLIMREMFPLPFTPPERAAGWKKEH